MPKSSHTYARHIRLVGSLKLWVSFAEYSLFYRALLQKGPTFRRSLLIVATLLSLLTHMHHNTMEASLRGGIEIYPRVNVTHVNESWIHMTESCHTHGRVMPHVCTAQVCDKPCAVVL